MKRIILLLTIVLSSFLIKAQGIILKSTSETLELLSSSAADLDYQINWADIVLASGATPGSSEGKITSATTTIITAAPSASTYRLIKSITVKNIHASTSNTVTFKKDISSTEYQLTGSIVLQAGESVTYTDQESWIRFSSGGVKQETSVSFQVDVQTFTANGTWAKPTSYTPKEVTVMAWGAGGGGGAGGSHSATPANVSGGAGGASGSYAAGGGGAYGTDGASPTAGSTGSAATSVRGGFGGGGGGTTVTASTNGASGGNGGQGGGGGGGGGAGMNPGLGGNGGQGGAGYMIVITK